MSITDMPKHTPGPWESEQAEGFAYHFITARHGARAIAKVYGGSQESDANMRVIKVAPKLLVAAKDAEALLQRIQGEGLLRPETEQRWVDDAVAGLQSVIAEAEGRT